MAPEVISNQGRIFILMLWTMLIAVSLLGISKVEQDFSLEFFLVEGDPLTKFIRMNSLYFQEGDDFGISQRLDNYNIASEEI